MRARPAARKKEGRRRWRYVCHNGRDRDGICNRGALRENIKVAPVTRYRLLVAYHLSLLGARQADTACLQSVGMMATLEYSQGIDHDERFCFSLRDYTEKMVLLYQQNQLLK